MAQAKMGLGSPPDPIFLHVAESADEQGEVVPWHMYDHDSKKQIPVKDRALTGVISGLRMKMGPEFKGKRPIKLQIQVDAGEQSYVVQSGVETTFSRGILLAMDMVDDLTEPLTIVVANGGEKVVFGRLHRSVSKERIKVMWDKERKIMPLVQKLQSKLGQRPQSWDDVQATAISGRPENEGQDDYTDSPDGDSDDGAPF